MKYSLRELILLIFGLGSFLGWAVLLASGHYEQHKLSPFLIDHAKWRINIYELLESLKESGPVIGTNNPTTFPGRQSAYHELHYAFTLSPDNAPHFMKALKARLCESIVNSQSSAVDISGIVDQKNGGYLFNLPYSRGDVCGIVRVYLLRRTGHDVRLLVLAYEQHGYFRF